VRKRIKQKTGGKQAELERENHRLEVEIKRVQRERDRLKRDNERLHHKNDGLHEDIEQLKKELDVARRAGKRQAAPFSKGDPKTKPRRPGRKRGKNHGRHGHRKPPMHVDEVVDAPLPTSCPHCQGAVDEIDVQAQYQTELPPVRPHVTRFDIHVGQCAACGKRVQGRHPQQISDALGAAASQLGPRAQALASELHVRYGLSFGKVQDLFSHSFDVSVTRGGLSLATARVARVVEPTYQAFHVWIRKAPIVSPDETGWRVGGLGQWLWAFATPELTVYAIQDGRGFKQAAKVLGKDYAGTLARDGWAPYRQFTEARHQTCLAHLLRRCHENLKTALRGTARVPRAVRDILKGALALRARAQADDVSAHGLRSLVGKLRARMDRLLSWRPGDEENRKLLGHLKTEQEALFTFLDDIQVPATNYWSEQAIRPAVVNRKVFGGNRTWAGAHTQEVLSSFFQTSRQRGHDPTNLLVECLRDPHPYVVERLEPSWIHDPTHPPAPP
jgi:transposase